MKILESYLNKIEQAENSLKRWDLFYNMVLYCFKENCRGRHIKTSDIFFEIKKRKIPEYREMTVFFARGQQLLAKSEGMDIYGDRVCF